MRNFATTIQCSTKEEDPTTASHNHIRLIIQQREQSQPLMSNKLAKERKKPIQKINIVIESSQAYQKTCGKWSYNKIYTTPLQSLQEGIVVNAFTSRRGASSKHLHQGNNAQMSTFPDHDWSCFNPEYANLQWNQSFSATCLPANDPSLSRSRQWDVPMPTDIIGEDTRGTWMAHATNLYRHTLQPIVSVP
jgi:hypothetical protein